MKTATNSTNHDDRLLYISLERGTVWFSRTVVRLKDETMLRPNQALPEGIPFAEGIPSEGTS